MYKRKSIIVIVAVLLLTVIQLFFISKLEFKYDFESFFSKTDLESKYYFDYRDKFENDADFSLIGIENKEGVFQQDFLLRVDSLVKALRKVTYMERVQCITNTKTFLASSYAVTPINLIHLNDFSRLKDDSINVFNQEELVGTFISKDAKAITIYAKKENMTVDQLLEGETIAEKEKMWLTETEAVVSNFAFDEVHIAGRVKAENYYVEKMKWEFVVFIMISTVLIILFLYLSFRTLWGVVLPLMVVLISVVWSVGFMAVTGHNVDIMSILLPLMMFVVGMSDVVHIVTKYLQELRQGFDKIEAIKTTIKEVGLATFLTSLTTAIGFLTLMTSGIKPIINFGLYTAIGVVFAYLLAFSLLPAFLILLKTPKIEVGSNQKLFWGKQLHLLFGWVLRNRKIVLVAMLVIGSVSFYGVSKVKVNSQLIDEVNEGDPLKDDFLFFEKHFVGVRPFEVALELGEDASSILDYEVLVEISKIENFLKRHNINQITSPLTMYKYMNRAFNNGDPTSFSLPSEAVFIKSNKLLKKFKNSKEFGLLFTEDRKLGRLTGIVTDIGSNQSKQIKDEFHLFMKESIDSRLLKPKLTGSAYLIDRTNDHLSSNMMIGLGMAFVIVALIMGLLFKSLRIVLISFIPNVLPLVMIGAILGFTGIGLKISTSIIFTIAFGIAVDDTIHFMSKFKIELMKGRSYLYAIKRTFISTGKAVIVTSFILVSGFLTLMYSDFNGTFYIGLLVSLTLLFAVVADLFLIPTLLLLLVDKEHVEKMRTLFKKNK